MFSLANHFLQRDMISADSFPLQYCIFFSLYLTDSDNINYINNKNINNKKSLSDIEELDVPVRKLEFIKKLYISIEIY